jgi:bacterioferritin
MDDRKLIEGLNQDLADELGTVCCYIQQASTAWGITGHEVREVLKREVSDEVKHILFLADKIAALGGTPVVRPSGFTELKDLRMMLEYDLEMERQAIRHYTERVHQDEALGNLGLKVQLEEIIAVETEHAEELVRRLG